MLGYLCTVHRVKRSAVTEQVPTNSVHPAGCLPTTERFSALSLHLTVL
jgi:hypothetical protein